MGAVVLIAILVATVPQLVGSFAIYLVCEPGETTKLCRGPAWPIGFIITVATGLAAMLWVILYSECLEWHERRNDS
jgi:hypothetical protein